MSLSPDTILQTLLACRLADVPIQVVLLKDEPQLPNYVCYPRDNNGLRDRGVFGLSLDLDPTIAQVKAVAECIERIALFQCPRAMHKAPQLNDLAWADKWFVGDAAGFLPPLRLVPAVELPTMRQTFVPAQLVYLNCPKESVCLRAERTSCGAACGFSHDQSCIARGLLELLERHFCYRAFYDRIPVLPLRASSERTQSLIEDLTRHRMDVRLFGIPNQYALPIVSAVVLDYRDDYPAVRCGSKASFDWEDACYGAICEAIQSRRLMRVMQAAGRIPKFELQRATQVRNAFQRFCYWNDSSKIPALLNQFHIVDGLRETAGLPESPTLEELLVAVTSDKHRILYCDVTPSGLLDCGIQIGKVIASGFHTLYEDEQNARPEVNRRGQVEIPHPWC